MKRRRRKVKPYYQDDVVTIYHGDGREIVPKLGRLNGWVVRDEAR